MRKKLVFLIACCLILSGCNANSNIKEQEKNANYGTGEKNIVATICGINDYAVSYGGISGLAKHSEVIVYGEVVDVHYGIESNGYCYTTEEVKVIESIKGGFEKDEIVLVSKDQGVVSVEEYIDSFADRMERIMLRMDYAQFGINKLEQIYIMEMEQNDVMSEIGQKGIYFLEKSAFYDTEKTFCRLSGPEAEYLEVNENEFIRNVEASVLASNPAVMSEEEGEINVPKYSMEELISKMNLGE